jgi:hypothetical protein
MADDNMFGQQESMFALKKLSVEQVSQLLLFSDMFHCVDLLAKRNIDGAILCECSLTSVKGFKLRLGLGDDMQADDCKRFMVSLQSWKARGVPLYVLNANLYVLNAKVQCWLSISFFSCILPKFEVWPVQDGANGSSSTSETTNLESISDSLMARLLSTSFIESVIPGTPLHGLFSSIDRTSLNLSRALSRLRYAAAEGTICPYMVDTLFYTADQCNDAAQRAEFEGKLPSGLTADEVAIIKLYSAPVEPAEMGLYYQINKALRENGRRGVWPFAPVILFLIMAMEKLPAVENCTVYRGVRCDLTDMYKTGSPPVTWSSFTSTTTKISVLHDATFLGVSGPRTMFMIKLTQGRARSIAELSMVAGEDEVILPPNSRFHVECVLPSNDGLLHVQLTELELKYY